MNRHDDWVAFRDAHGTAFGETGLPRRVWASRERLFRLLEFGIIDDAGAKLGRLSDPQFLALESLVDAFHPDNQDGMFPAMTRERTRRFGRCG
jgi:hypothetical protein